MRTAPHNAVGGKGHERGHVVDEGKREGMAGRPNHPEHRKGLDKVRQLQRRLCAAAKQSPERRFHALYDRMWRRDVLDEAWKRVKRNRGSAGLDSQTIAEVEQHGVERFLVELGDVLRAGEYRPSATLRRYIPKADGKQRPLGIPTVRDRVVQMAAKLVLEPIFGAADNSINQAGESPVAAIARDGCVAMRDVHDERSSRMKLTQTSWRWKHRT
jgi:hypothetical protein